MLREYLDSEPLLATKPSLTQVNRQESVLGALALLLGTETEETSRIRAVRRLARAGTEETNLVLLLRAMSEQPEITSPPWPHEPPQYACCGRLLYLLSRNLHLPLDTFLFHPALTQPTGPVLWAAMIEAVSLMPTAVQRSEYEPLLSAGLRSPWATVRYSAAMALAKLAEKVRLSAETVRALHDCLAETEALPVLVAASYALVRMQEERGLDMLLHLLQQDTPTEGRKAAAFVLAMEQPLLISREQRDRLTRSLLLALQDADEQVTQHAAHALRSYGNEEILEQLCSLLVMPQPTQVMVAALTAIEEMMSNSALRQIMQRARLAATRIVPLLRCETPEVRQQASYTLAAIGGNYATSVLGATISDAASPAHRDAIESLRLLPGAAHLPWRPHVVRWLLSCLRAGNEQVQISALDSLAYLAWQARGQQKTLQAYRELIEQDGALEWLLTGESAWVRQRALELAELLRCQQPALHRQILRCLRHDLDSGVRACSAYVISQLAPYWPTSSTPIPDLILALVDPDASVAETALNALALLAPAGDPLIVYALRELTVYGYAEENSLIRRTRVLLKRWEI
jgi:HEAT repeat protein